MKKIEIEKIKYEVINYLGEEVKKTPKEFKKLIDCLVKFYKDCETNLGIFVSLEYDCWGECTGLTARLAEWENRSIPENEYMVLSASTIANLFYKNINSLVARFVKEKYNAEEAFELYGILMKELELDEKFNEYKLLYKYYIIAMRLKENIERALENSKIAEKSEEYHIISLRHNNLTMKYKMKYKI